VLRDVSKNHFGPAVSDEFYLDVTDGVASFSLYRSRHASSKIIASVDNVDEILGDCCMHVVFDPVLFTRHVSSWVWHWMGGVAQGEGLFGARRPLTPSRSQ